MVVAELVTLFAGHSVPPARGEEHADLERGLLLPPAIAGHLRIDRSAYGIYHPNNDRHVSRNVHISNTSGETVNRGHDDFSVQYGSVTFDGLTFDNCGQSRDGTGAP
jgi:hypothetical protein